MTREEKREKRRSHMRSISYPGLEVEGEGARQDGSGRPGLRALTRVHNFGEISPNFGEIFCFRTTSGSEFWSVKCVILVSNSKI